MSPIAGASFQWQDYLMFSLMLAVSSLIGVFFALKNLRMKNTSSDEMLTGSRRLSALPVALSLVASFASASSLLGIPVQVYTQGGNQWLWAFGIMPCFLTVTFFIMPIFYRLRLTNAYEYLELRFNKTIRTMASTAFTLIILIYMAAALYGPAVALSQVTGLSREISMLAIGLVCTFYTSIGGIRAVVWTDAFQIILVFACSLIILSKGATDVGGWDQVWDLAANGSRLPYFDMNPDPFLPHTFWTFAVGGGLNVMTVYGGNQANLQRYGSVKTLAQARGALLACMVMWIVYISLQCLLGLVMYASFLTCDPLTSGIVSRKDQLVPLFVMETMGTWPGLPGFFVASIFSASISTVSSGINSLAAVTLEDVVKPIYKWTKADLSKKSSYRITVALSLLFGALTIGLAYAVDCLGETAFLISFNVFGMVGSPVLGVIINGIFIRFVNSWGAGAGLLVSLAVGLYVGIDPMLDPPPVKTLPLRTDGCWAANLTSEMTSALLTTTAAAYTDATSLSPSGEGESSRIYLSYQHYSTLTLLISVVVASLVSLVTGRNSKQVVDPRTYIHYSWTSLTSDTQTTYDMNDTSGESSDDGKVILADINRDGKSGHQENGEKPSKIIPDGLV